MVDLHICCMRNTAHRFQELFIQYTQSLSIIYHLIFISNQVAQTTNLHISDQLNILTMLFSYENIH